MVGTIPLKPSFLAWKVIRSSNPCGPLVEQRNPGSDPETIDAGTIPARYQAMLDTKSIVLGGRHTIHYNHDRDMIWRYDQVLPSHPNGMRFSVFDEAGDMLATNEYFRCVIAELTRDRFLKRTHDVTSVGGGFVVNEKTKTAGENMFYKGVDKRAVHVARLSKTTGGIDAAQVEKDTDPTHPPFPFKSGDTLLALSRRHNVGVPTHIVIRSAHPSTDDDCPDCIRQRVFIRVHR